MIQVGAAGVGKPLGTRDSTFTAHRLRQSNNYTAELGELIDAYGGDPIPVSFRKLAGPQPADDSTHGLFPYPARLLRQIPMFMLGAGQTLDRTEQVVDPFCGSGTALLEAAKWNLSSIGFDANPLACLMAAVKTTPLDENRLRRSVVATVQHAKSMRGANVPSRAFVERWFDPAAVSVLSRLVVSAEAETDPSLRRFLQALVACAAHRMSRRDPRIPVPVIDKRVSFEEWTTAGAWKLIAKVANSNIRKVSSLAIDTVPQVTHNDARSEMPWGGIHAEGVTVCTSPPYGSAQKYVRSASLELAWLGHTVNGRTIDIERQSIGREHLSQQELSVQPHGDLPKLLLRQLKRVRLADPRRAAIYAHYFNDMTTAFQRMTRQESVKTVILVAGPNWVAGERMETHEYLSEMLVERDFKILVALRDRIRGRTLLTKRRTASATPATEEFVYMLVRD